MWLAQTISNVLMFIGFIGLLSTPKLSPESITCYVTLIIGIMISISLDVIRLFKRNGGETTKKEK